MPVPRKLDLIPEELRDRLRQVLAARGFGDIVAVTEDLNFWLEEKGLELRVGKSAVGEFSMTLKRQRDAFRIAETVLADADISEESKLHKTLMQMIAASAVHMMTAVTEGDQQLDPKDLHFMGKMLKDLMSSAGLREKLVAEDRRRQREEQAAALDEAAKTGRVRGLTAETVDQIKRQILGIE
jgi:hypothetical protein